jgi:SH3 domain protein
MKTVRWGGYIETWCGGVRKPDSSIFAGVNMEATGIRKLEFIVLFALVILLSSPFQSVRARTQYVTDMLILNLRDRPGEDYEVIRTLKTDTPVEVLEERGRYLRVRTKDGEEGWVANQYITSKTPKPLMIAGLKKEIRRLEEKIERLEKSPASLRNDLDIAKLKVKELEKETNKYRQEASLTSLELKQLTEKYNTLLEQSGNVVELMKERNRLRAANDQLNAEMEQLRQKNAPLKRLGIVWWFVAGAGVFFAGLITGKISRKKKRFY